LLLLQISTLALAPRIWTCSFSQQLTVNFESVAKTKTNVKRFAVNKRLVIALCIARTNLSRLQARVELGGHVMSRVMQTRISTRAAATGTVRLALAFFTGCGAGVLTRIYYTSAGCGADVRRNKVVGQK
jgi:hypothetical protein